MLLCFRKGEAGSHIDWYLMPVLLICLETRVPVQQTLEILLFAGSNVWEGEKGDLNSISTQTYLQMFCSGLNLILNLKKI